MLVPITGLYAAVLTVVGLTLMNRVGRIRDRTGVSILHGDDMHLALAMRQHGNFIETVPLALIHRAPHGSEPRAAPPSVAGRRYGRHGPGDARSGRSGPVAGCCRGLRTAS